ncbi:MAG: hypothetical protein ACI97N_001349 [Cognaticolwellia sp.]|jgi:hypothetical protein
MRRQLVILFFTQILIFNAAFTQPIFDYSFSASMDTYNELDNPTSLSNGQVWDEETYSLGLGFLFNIGGESFDTILINTNGYLTFENQTSDETYIATVLGDADLEDRGAGTIVSESPISYQIDGMIGNQIIKIEYKNIGFFDGIMNDSISFQIWLYENTDQIEYRFGSGIVSNPNIVFQGNSGPICGLFNVHTNNLQTGFTLTNSAIFPDTTQFVNFDVFNIPSLDDLIPEHSVYTFAYNHPVANKTVFRESLDFKVLSNPTIDFSIIDIILTESSMIFVDVFDMHGNLLKTRKIFHSKGKCQIKLDLSSYSSGTYLCRIRVGSKVATKKIIKI